jgi:hypothetical protein
MSTIPVSSLATVNPSVIAAGGAALSASGLILTPSTRVPINGSNLPTVASFPNGVAVSNFFGPSSNENTIAQGGLGKGTGYFGGFDGSNKKPGAILFAQFNQNAVAAYMRGGPGLTLTQVQAINATLNVVVDGYARTGACNLTGATSLSNAAGLIQTALNAALPAQGTSTASTIAAQTTTYTASINGNLMTVTTAPAGGPAAVLLGSLVTGTGVAASTVVTGQISGTTGGIGVYAVSVSQTVASTAITQTCGLLTIGGAVGGSAYAVGQTITGGTTSAGTIIIALGTGTGGAGTYYVNLTQTVASAALNSSGTAVAVTYDSVSTAFIITSGIVGPASTIAFATGAAAPLLLLTSATGAVLSQGAASANIATFMNNLVTQNSNWVSFMTGFDPDGGAAGGSAQKQAFAAWKQTQNNRFLYVPFDSDPTPTTTLPASSSLGQVLAGNGDSGTCIMWEATDLNHAAFVCGAVASIDFTQIGGRATLAFKSQGGLVASVSDPTIAANLAGNPQQANSFGNGYNFYGAYGSATTSFVWMQRGTVTGPFIWLDSYVNQVVMNYSFQNALLTLAALAKSIPYSTIGNSQIEAALAPTIQQFKNFGAFGPGVLSASEIAAVNNAAGANVAPSIASQGYYLQILPAAPSVRAQRTSPPMTFWYLDQGSVQSFNLGSVSLQ